MSNCVHVKGRALIHTTAWSTSWITYLIQIVFWQQIKLGLILMCFLSPSSAYSVSAFREKKPTKPWLLLHLSPRCQYEHDPGVIYDAPRVLFIKWRPVSASPASHLHFLISSALLLFKFACCLEKRMDGWMGDVVALALPLHHPEQQRGDG